MRKFDVCLGLVHRSVVKLFQGIVIHRPVLFFNQQLISWPYCTIFQTAKLTRTKSFGTILHLSFAIVGTCSPGATSDLSPFFSWFFHSPPALKIRDSTFHISKKLTYRRLHHGGPLKPHCLNSLKHVNHSFGFQSFDHHTNATKHACTTNTATKKTSKPIKNLRS